MPVVFLQRLLIKTRSRSQMNVNAIKTNNSDPVAKRTLSYVGAVPSVVFVLHLGSAQLQQVGSPRRSKDVVLKDSSL